MAIRPIYIVAIVLGTLFSQLLFASGGNVQFSGSNTTYYQSSNRRGDGSEIPKELLRNDLNMTLTLFGIPLSTSTFLSTEDRDNRQSLNNFRFYVDFEQLARNRARGELPTLGMPDIDTDIAAPMQAPGLMRFLSLFSTLEAGRCRPNYGPLSVQGIALTGANVELNTDIFYAAFATGRTRRAIEADETTAPVYQRNLTFARGGIGKIEGTHFHLSFMQGADNDASIKSTDIADSLYIYAGENTVVGAGAQIAIDNVFSLGGNAAYSLHTRNINGIEGDSEIPQQVTDYATVNLTSSADYAYMINTRLNLKTTRISGGFDYIGSGFTTYGNTNLVNDAMTYHGRVDQNFFERKVPVAVYFRQQSDNLVGWKDATTTTTAYGITAGLRLRNLPYLQLAFTPNFQKYDTDSVLIRNASNIFNASTGHSYTLGNLFLSTNFNYYYQLSKNEVDSLENNSLTNTYTLGQSVSFQIPLSLSGSISFSTNEYSDETVNIVNFNTSASYRAFGKWQNTLGVNSSNEIDRSSRLGFYYDTKINVLKMADLGARLEHNSLSHSNPASKNHDYDEIVARLSLMVRW